MMTLQGALTKIPSTTLLLAAAAQITLAAPQIDGTTIVLPDNGWYQVQRADNYQSICEGQFFCEVEPGLYIVINHTTGERFESVEVPEQSNSDPDEIMVLGNVISWPDDGWYQVQDETTYQSFCEGGSHCTVPDGNYIVINHTTGTRYPGIVVGMQNSGRVINQANYLDILRNVVTITNVEAIERDRLTADDVSTKLDGMGRQVLGGDTPSAGLTLGSQTQDTASRFMQDYICTAEGTLSLNLFVSPAPVDIREVAFDQCSYNGAEFDGKYSYFSARRSSDVSTFNNYSTWYDNNNGFRINGQWSDDNIPFNNADSIRWIDTTYEQQIDGDATIINSFNWSRTGYETILPENYVTGYVNTPDGAVAYAVMATHTATLDSRYHVIADWTRQEDILVEIDLEFASTYLQWAALPASGITPEIEYPVSDLGTPLTLSSTPDFDPASIFVVENTPRRTTQWETGQIRLTANDGSTVTMRPMVDDPARVEIFINGSTEVISNTWANGLQINCSTIFAGECL